MIAQTHPTERDSHDEASKSERRRAAWRQRLVEAERGFVGCIRGDAVFFVHFFGISAVIAAATILGVSWVHWIGIVGCLALVLTAEMFNQALKELAQPAEKPIAAAGKRAVAMGTAAVMVACAGSTIIMFLVFGQRLRELLQP
ncbi:MAG: diacylglycerol kinase [Planctomycetaceae bacterium]